jgi:ADP-ribosylglycohydrolase
VIDYESRVRGCLLGGAIGDALGAPVEFMSAVQIEALVGDFGVRDFLPAQFGSVKARGLVTDDTQMTLFTVEGIIRAVTRERTKGLGFTAGVLHHAYLRWLDTQKLREPSGLRDGWLQAERWLYSRRAPGNTCLSALTASNGESFGDAAINDSKGCGGVMRSAPFGLVTTYEPSDRFAYEMAATAAGYTHGHSTGQHASGALALIVRNVVGGEPLHSAIPRAAAYLEEAIPRSHETTGAIRRAFALATEHRPSRELLETLGGGWVAEEALAIAVYCAMAYPDADQVLDALALAVTHSGDSDSTGAICGNILGALHGHGALPAALEVQLEGRGAILELADDMVIAMSRSSELFNGDECTSEAWWERYPGW